MPFREMKDTGAGLRKQGRRWSAFLEGHGAAGTCPFLGDVGPGQQLNRDFQGYVIVR
jgi:hypothetical protein